MMCKPLTLQTRLQSRAAGKERDEFDEMHGPFHVHCSRVCCHVKCSMGAVYSTRALKLAQQQVSPCNEERAALFAGTLQ